MKVIIAGSRSIENINFVFNAINIFKENFYISKIISGAAPGIDTKAIEAAEFLKIPWKE